MLGLVASAALAQDSMNPEKIVYRHLEAIGGKKALRSINTIVRKGTLSLGPQGPEIPFDIYSKRPNSTRQELEFQGNQIILATDGSKAWQINPLSGSPDAQEMPPALAEHFMRTAYMDDIFFENMKTRGVTLKYVAGEEDDGHQFHHVLVTFADGHEQQRYYDKQSGLLTKITQTQPTQTGQAEITTTFHDWRAFNGLKYPVKMETSAGQTLVFEETKINMALEDSLFQIPVQ